MYSINEFNHKFESLIVSEAFGSVVSQTKLLTLFRCLLNISIDLLHR